MRAWRDGDQPQLDIDFVVHEAADGSMGPAVDFALNAQVGDPVGLLDQGLSYDPNKQAPWQLLVADETGLPALANIIESSPENVAIQAFIEIPTDEDRQPIALRPNVSVHWVARNDVSAKPGEKVLDVVKNASLPEGEPYAFAVGEQALATGVRRFLVNDKGVPKDLVNFVGYYRYGHVHGN